MKTLGQLEAENPQGFRNEDNELTVAEAAAVRQGYWPNVGKIKTLDQLEAENPQGFKNEDK